MSARQARWQEFLAEFNFEWLHCPRQHNIVVDALRRKEVVAYIMTLSKVISDFNEQIKHATILDAKYEKLRQQVRNGEARKYWLEGELLVFK